jgi:hypothetical protein
LLLDTGSGNGFIVGGAGKSFDTAGALSGKNQSHIVFVCFYILFDKSGFSLTGNLTNCFGKNSFLFTLSLTLLQL